MMRCGYFPEVEDRRFRFVLMMIDFGDYDGGTESKIRLRWEYLRNSLGEGDIDIGVDGITYVI
jgi:hypothetical protein